MIVDDFHIVGVAFRPHEAYAILIIDPNAVLALALAVQQLQPVSGRHAQIIQRHRGMQQEELLECPHSQMGGNPSASPRLPKLLRIRIPEARYHAGILPRYGSSVKQYHFKALTEKQYYPNWVRGLQGEKHSRFDRYARISTVKIGCSWSQGINAW